MHNKSLISNPTPTSSFFSVSRMNSFHPTYFTRSGHQSLADARRPESVHASPTVRLKTRRCHRSLSFLSLAPHSFSCLEEKRKKKIKTRESLFRLQRALITVSMASFVLRLLLLLRLFALALGLLLLPVLLLLGTRVRRVAICVRVRGTVPAGLALLSLLVLLLLLPVRLHGAVRLRRRALRATRVVLRAAWLKFQGKCVRSIIAIERMKF